MAETATRGGSAVQNLEIPTISAEMSVFFGPRDWKWPVNDWLRCPHISGEKEVCVIDRETTRKSKGRRGEEEEDTTEKREERKARERQK